MNSFGSQSILKVGNKSYEIFRLNALEAKGLALRRLPYSLRVLLENLLRQEDGKSVTADDIEFFAKWQAKAEPAREIAFMPARVLMQDFTGVPAIVDLAAMRDAMKQLGGDPEKINPLQPAELVIDHSVQVDEFGTSNAYSINAALEFQRNRERYAFLKWGQTAFRNFSTVPPGMGICHQVNLEYLARVVFTTDGERRPGAGVSRHAGGHRLPYHHDQRTGGAGLGRRRHRSRGRHAGPAGFHAGAAGGRLQADRQAARGRDGYRPGADRDRDAAQAGRGGQVCRVLRLRASAS